MPDTAAAPALAAPDLHWPPDAEARVDRLGDASLDVVVVLGRTRMTLEELLTLEPGEIVETSRPCGDALEVLVNGRHFCSGEVVVVGDQLALRVTDFPSAA